MGKNDGERTGRLKGQKKKDIEKCLSNQSEQDSKLVSEYKYIYLE